METSSKYSYNPIPFPHAHDPHQPDSLAHVSDDTDFDLEAYLNHQFFEIPELQFPVTHPSRFSVDPKIISRRDITQPPSPICSPDLLSTISCQDSFPVALTTIPTILSSRPQQIIDQSDLTQSPSPQCRPIISTTISSQSNLPVTIAETAAVLSPSSQQKISSRAHQESENITKSLKLKPPSQQAKRKSSKNYPCPECLYKTPNLKRLGDHMRDAHKKQAFKCDNCETRVTRYDNLESHKKSCVALLASGSPAASVTGPSIEARPAKRQRVSLRSLQPVPLQPLPQPTSPSESERVVSTTSSLPQNERSNANTQPQSRETSQLPNEGTQIVLTPNGNSTKTAADWAREIECLKVRLKIKDLEVDFWKMQCEQLQLR